MGEYQLYVPDSEGMHTVARRFTCPDDGTAMELATCMAEGDQLTEVWQDTKLIGTTPGLSDRPEGVVR